jgi:hypothetical protein
MLEWLGVELRSTGQPLRLHSGQAQAAVPTKFIPWGKYLGWETGIEPATAGATVRCSAS